MLLVVGHGQLGGGVAVGQQHVDRCSRGVLPGVAQRFLRGSVERVLGRSGQVAGDTFDDQLGRRPGFEPGAGDQVGNGPRGRHRVLAQRGHRAPRLGQPLRGQPLRTSHLLLRLFAGALLGQHQPGAL